MTNTQKKLVVAILNETVDWQCDQFKIIENSSQIIVSSLIDETDVFFNTSLFSILQSFNTYVRYNKENNKCEMVIF